MMKFMERLDQHMSAKTWVANSTARSASNTPLGGSRYPQEILSRHPSNSNLHQLCRQTSIDISEQRKLKEQRLAELARQLELTQLQNDSPRSKPISEAPSRPRSPPLQPLYPPMNDLDLQWNERQQKMQEINQHIEFLKSSGFPPNRTPSPIQTSNHLGLQASMDQVHHNSTLPHNHYTPAVTSPPSHHGLRHQPSKRSVNSQTVPASHPLKTLPSMVFGKSNTLNKDRSPSSSQVGYYQALTEAENLIGRLRKSHDDLLARAKDLENQLKLKEDENQNLMTQNQRLEALLTDERKIREKIQLENDHLTDQLKSLPFPSSINSHDKNRSASFDHHTSSARAELLKREEHLQRHYAYNYSMPTTSPEPFPPGPNKLRSQTSPQPAQQSNVTSSNISNPNRGQTSAKTSAFRFPTNRDPDAAYEDPRLANSNNRSNSNISPSTHQRNLRSNGSNDPLGPPYYLQDPVCSSTDQLPLPPFMNNQLPWNYHNHPGLIRPKPFPPAYGFY